jgi:hypothetical protein
MSHFFGQHADPVSRRPIRRARPSRADRRAGAFALNGLRRLASAMPGFRRPLS